MPALTCPHWDVNRLIVSVSLRAVRLSQLAPETAAYSSSRRRRLVFSMNSLSRMDSPRDSSAFTVTSATYAASSAATRQP